MEEYDMSVLRKELVEKGFEVLDVIYPGKSAGKEFQAKDNLIRNFGMSLEDLLDEAQVEVSEFAFKNANKRNPGAKCAIIKSIRTSVPEVIENVSITMATAEVECFMNDGKHVLAPSWLPSGKMLIRFAKEEKVPTKPDSTGDAQKPDSTGDAQ